MSVNMNVFWTRRLSARRAGSFQASNSPTSSSLMARVGQASAASRRTSSSTLSTSTHGGLGVITLQPIEDGRGDGDAVAGTDANRPVDVNAEGHGRLLDPGAEGEGCGLGARRGADARVQRGQLAGNRRLVDVQLGGDLAVGLALCQQPQQPRVVGVDPWILSAICRSAADLRTDQPARRAGGPPGRAANGRGSPRRRFAGRRAPG